MSTNIIKVYVYHHISPHMLCYPESLILPFVQNSLYKRLCWGCKVFGIICTVLSLCKIFMHIISNIQSNTTHVFPVIWLAESQWINISPLCTSCHHCFDRCCHAGCFDRCCRTGCFGCCCRAGCFDHWCHAGCLDCSLLSTMAICHSWC